VNPTSDDFEIALNLKSQELEQCDRASFDYRGQSMFPLFFEGDIVVIKPYRLNSPKIGDVIVFERNSHLVMHRLIMASRSVEHQSLVYTCKGDNCLVVDAPIGRTQVLGKAILIQRQQTLIKLDSIWGRLTQKLLAYFSLIELSSKRRTTLLNRAKRLTCSLLKVLESSQLVRN